MTTGTPFEALFDQIQRTADWFPGTPPSRRAMRGVYRYTFDGVYHYTLDIDCLRPVCIIHTMNSREIIKRLKADGWNKVGAKGAHHQFKHPTKKGRVTVPHPSREIPIGTLKSIERQSGLKLR